MNHDYLLGPESELTQVVDFHRAVKEKAREVSPERDEDSRESWRGIRVGEGSGGVPHEEVDAPVPVEDVV